MKHFYPNQAFILVICVHVNIAVVKYAEENAIIAQFLITTRVHNGGKSTIMQSGAQRTTYYSR